MATDRQFDIQSDFCRDVLVRRLREIVSGCDAIDIQDIALTELEFLSSNPHPPTALIFC